MCAQIAVSSTSSAEGPQDDGCDGSRQQVTRMRKQPVLERQRWLIRHGESAANAGAVTNDPAAIPLTDTGTGQARSIAVSVSRRPDLIVVSPYLRTRQTAEPTIARFPDVPVETWPVQEFTYLSPNRCVGTTAARRPLVEDYWQRCDPAYVDGPGAEAFSALLERVRLMRHRLSEAAAGFVLVFTHGQVMQAFRQLGAFPDRDDQALMAGFLAADQEAPIRNGDIRQV